MMPFLLCLLAVEPTPVETLAYREGPIETIGRYQEFLDSRLRLHGSPVVFLVAEAAHTRLLLGLAPGKDRIIVRGTFTAPGNVSVSALEQAPRDTEVFARRAEAAADDARVLQNLGERARAVAREYHDEELEQTALDLLRRAFVLRRQGIAPDDHQAHLAWARDMIALLQDRAWALRELTPIMVQKSAWEEAERFLLSLGCVKWRGDWFLHEDFLRAHGMVQINGTWVPREDASFLRARETLGTLIKRQEILRAGTADFYRISAQHGRLLAGMTREEAVTAWGFPDSVRRTTLLGHTVDQWQYGDDAVYLLDDIVAIVPGAARP